LHGYEWTYYLSLQKGLGPKAPLAHQEAGQPLFLDEQSSLQRPTKDGPRIQLARFLRLQQHGRNRM